MKISFFLFLFFFTSSLIFGQKTLTLEECQALFVKNNLSLLAQEYGIQAAEATALQAKIWDLPTFSADLNLLNPVANKILDIGQKGQKVFFLQQLIYLGGKKRKEFDFALSNVSLSRLQFEQLLVNLNYQLCKSFYTAYFEEQKLELLNRQILAIDSLVAVLKSQKDRDNDLFLIQSFEINLRTDKINTKKNIYAEQETLKILTSLREDITPKIENTTLSSLYTKDISSLKDSLFVIASSKNPDYLFAQKLIENNEMYLRWQKSMAVPDINVGGSYDQRGGAFNDQLSLLVTVPIPLWNKNRGRIKAAQMQVKESAVQKDFKSLTLQSNLEKAYLDWQIQFTQYKELVEGMKNIDVAYINILKNFQSNNMSLLEFTEFMDNYHQNIYQVSEIQKQLILSGTTINYLTNTKIF